MTRQYGRAPAGQRLLDAVPGGHWNTTTMISAIRLEGVATAMVTEGATNTLEMRESGALLDQSSDTQKPLAARAMIHEDERVEVLKVGDLSA